MRRPHWDQPRRPLGNGRPPSPLPALLPPGSWPPGPLRGRCESRRRLSTRTRGRGMVPPTVRRPSLGLLPLLRPTWGAGQGYKHHHPRGRSMPWLGRPPVHPRRTSWMRCACTPGLDSWGGDGTQQPAGFLQQNSGSVPSRRRALGGADQGVRTAGGGVGRRGGQAGQDAVSTERRVAGGAEGQNRRAGWGGRRGKFRSLDQTRGQGASRDPWLEAPACPEQWRPT